MATFIVPLWCECECGLVSYAEARDTGGVGVV